MADRISYHPSRMTVPQMSSLSMTTIWTCLMESTRSWTTATTVMSWVWSMAVVSNLKLWTCGRLWVREECLWSTWIQPAQMHPYFSWWLFPMAHRLMSSTLCVGLCRCLDIILIWLFFSKDCQMIFLHLSRIWTNLPGLGYVKALLIIWIFLHKILIIIDLLNEFLHPSCHFVEVKPSFKIIHHSLMLVTVQTSQLTITPIQVLMAQMKYSSSSNLNQVEILKRLFYNVLHSLRG